MAANARKLARAGQLGIRHGKSPGNDPDSQLGLAQLRHEGRRLGTFSADHGDGLAVSAGVAAGSGDGVKKGGGGAIGCGGLPALSGGNEVAGDHAAETEGPVTETLKWGQDYGRRGKS